jgi:hypothetical protein
VRSNWAAALKGRRHFKGAACDAFRCQKGAATVPSGRAEKTPLHVCHVSEGLESSVPRCVESPVLKFLEREHALLGVLAVTISGSLTAQWSSETERPGRLSTNRLHI